MVYHIRDIRLFNNAGIAIPVCKAGSRLLPEVGPRTRFTTKETRVIDVCGRCLRMYARRYPWANPL